MSEQAMRVAMVAPPWLEVPPQGYGGIEAICADLANGLVERGHEVHLFGSGGTVRRRTSCTPTRTRRRTGSAPPSRRCCTRPGSPRRSSASRSISSTTTRWPALLLARGRRVPTIATVHGPLGNEYGEYLRLLGRSVRLVAISEAQRRTDPSLPWIATVYNAVPVHDYPFRSDKEDYALFLGRMSPDKGAHVAIDVAEEAGWRLLLLAKLSEPAEHAYFEEEVKPRLGGKAEWLGEADGARKRELLSAARCLLFPLQWEEPFGLVMIEALACGTPVVALNRGSVPEVVTDGVTGVLRDDRADLPAALDAVADIDPAACRDRAEREFELPVMIERYEQAYRKLLAAGS